MMEPKQYKVLPITLVVLHISLSGFLFHYTLGVFNPCTENVAASLNWGNNKDLFVTLFSAFIPIGQTIGCLATPCMLSTFGRRKSLILMSIVFISGSILIVLPHTFLFAIGRMLTGIATGIMDNIAPVYINEITPEEMVPTMGPLLIFISSCGLVFAYAFGLMLPTENYSTESTNYLWIFLFLFPALIALYQVLYFVFVNKLDTPQFYLEKNRVEEANSAIGMTYNENGVSSGLRRAHSFIDGKSSAGIKLTLRKMICEKRYFKMFRVAIILAIADQFCRATPIFFYSSNIFYSISGDVFMSRLITLGMGVVYMLSCLACIILMRFIGRRKLLLGGFFVITVDLLILGLFSGSYATDTAVSGVFLMLFFVPFGISLSGTLWSYLPEVLNDQILSFACILINFLSVITSFVFPIAAENFGISICFFLFQ